MEYHFKVECGSCDFTTTTQWDTHEAKQVLWQHAIAKHMDVLLQQFPPGVGATVSRKEGAVCPWCDGTGIHKGVGMKCNNDLFHRR